MSYWDDCEADSEATFFINSRQHPEHRLLLSFNSSAMSLQMEIDESSGCSCNLR